MRAEAFLEESTDNEPVQKLGSAEAFLTASDPEPATTSTEPAPSMNMGRGAVERGGQLLGGLFTAGNAMAEQAEQEYPLGGLVWEDGLIPDYKNPKEYQRWRAEQGGDEPLKAAADYWANFDAGYVPEHTWESVKQEFGEGGALSGSAWGEVLAYGAEQGVKSIPDMFAAMANLPGYVMARSGEIGEERARNKGKEGAELVDVAEAAPFALGSAILERMGASGITQAGAETLGKEALKAGIGKMAKEGAKAGAKEAGTEFLQEGIIEYLGEKLGTDAAMSVWEALDRGAAGAVAGGVYGTTAGTAGAAVNEIRNRRQSEAVEDEVAPPIINDEVVDEPVAAAEPEGEALPSDDNAPSADYPGRPEWANDQTNIFRDGARLETTVSGEPVDAFTQPEQPRPTPKPSAEEFLSESGTGVFRVPVDQIKVDPEQYQFRTRVNEKGVDQRLSGVKKWDDRRAGSVLLHRRKDGSLYVADGHHRVDLAKRLGQPEINAQIIDEADGVDVSAARVDAAMNNIADNKAEPIDVAKVFRDSEVPTSEVRDTFNLPNNQVVRDGESLSKLSDNVFGMVTAGQLNEKDGAAIGGAFAEQGQQEAAADAFQKVQPDTEYQRQLLINEIRAAEFAEAQGEQGGLFGDDPQEVSLMQDRLKVLDSLRQRLNSDKRLFKSLNDNADRATSAGNQIATEANETITQQSARTLDLISRVTTTPALNEMVNRAARRVYDGEIRSKVVAELKQELMNYEAGADAAVSRPTGAPQSREPASEPGQEPGASEPVSEPDTAGADQGRQPESQQDEVTPSLDLESQTEEQLAEQARAREEVQQAEARQKREEEQRAAADEQVDNFTLTGSDRAADVAMAAGQDDMFVSTPASRKADASQEGRPVSAEQTKRDAESIDAIGARLTEGLDLSKEADAAKAFERAADDREVLAVLKFGRRNSPAARRTVNELFDDLAGFYTESDNAQLANLAEQVMRTRSGEDFKESLLTRTDGDLMGVQLQNGAGNQFAVFLPDASEPGRFRVSYFDDRGFYGHTTRDTYKAALDEAWTDGFRSEAKGKLEELASTEAFAKGNELASLIAQVNRGDLTHAQYLEKARKLESFDDESRPMFSRSGVRQTETDAFKRWFGDSKIVDESGNPLVVYHGSQEAITSFHRDRIGEKHGQAGDYGGGFYFSADSGYTDRFGKTKTAAYLSIQNPLVIFDGQNNNDGQQGNVYRRFKRILRSQSPEKASEFLRGEGYDGVVVHGAGGSIGSGEFLEVVAFRPEQIKSATDNAGTFDPDTPDIRFSRTGPRNLFVAHNLSESNLEHVLELGGLAAPSLAVGRTDQGFADFGEITLLAPASMLESPKARTFDADVYTPRHPRAEYEINREAYAKQVGKLDNEYDLATPALDDLERDGMEAMARSPAYQYAWLKSRNKAPKAKRQKVDPVVRKIAKLGLDRFAMQTDPRVMKLAKDYYRDVQKQVREALGEDAPRANIYFDEDGSVSHGHLSQLTYKAARYQESDGYDVGQMKADLNKKLRAKAVARQYERWIKDQFNEVVKSQRMFAGFTPSGNKKYRPYNLENVVKEMTRKVHGGEGFNYGAGSVRSAYAAEMRRISQVQANRDRIVSPSQMEAIKEESNKRLQDTLEALKPYYKFDADGWGYTDDASSAIAEGRKGWNEAFNLDADSRAIITEFVDYLRNLPTAYFESKVGRAVDLSEFSVALVPKGTSKEAVDALRAKGLKVKRYDPNDPDARRAEIAKQEDLLFSKNGEYRRNPDSETETLTAQQARTYANNLMRDWKDRPRVVVADSISEFPQDLRAAIRKAQAEGDMRAVFWNQEVYVLAPRIPNTQALEEVILHEVVGHYGLRKMVGKELIPLLNRVYIDMARTDKATEIKRTYYPGNTFDASKREHRLVVAEELLAHLAESGKQRHRTLWQKIVTAVRDALRRLGFTISMSENDLLKILEGAQRTVEQGGFSRPSEADTYFRRAYHGTPHRFDKFSLEAIGTGEGAQAFGWGLYFAGNRSIAEYYQRVLSSGRGLNVPRARPLSQAPSRQERDAVNKAEQTFNRVLGAYATGKQGRVSWGGNLINLYNYQNEIGDLDAKYYEKNHEEIEQEIESAESAVKKKNPNWSEAEVEKALSGMGFYDKRNPFSVAYSEAIKELPAQERGNLYEVEIPDDSDLLDRDALLSEQPEKVQQALRKLPGETYRKITAKDVGGNEPTGSLIYNRLQEYFSRDSRDSIFSSSKADGAKDASQELNDVGIPGLRYLDNTSRGQGEGTHNYVIWDESVVSVQAVNDEIAQAEAYFSRTDQTQTEAFSKWFGDSKVVDENGEPLVVYHGTVGDFSEFSMKEYGTNFTGDYGIGFYFTQDPKVASGYADSADFIAGHKSGKSGGANVMPVYLKMENPLIVKKSFGTGDLWKKVPGAKTKQELTDGLISQGYDGVIVDGGIVGSRYISEAVVFNPEQIKSATGNTGTFDPDNADIRFSRADVPDLDPEPFGAPSDTLLRKMISKIADKFTVLKGVQQNITDRFGEIEEDADAYLAEELFHGKVENDIRLIQENMIQPLAEKMSEYDVSLAQLDEFLYAKHAPERNRVIAQRNDQFPDGGSGMTNAEAAAVIDQVEKSGKLDQFQELADSVYQMLERRRKILKDAGLLDEETLGAWEASYRHYVPLKGWAADEKQEAMPKIGKGFAIAGKESQMAGGRKSKASSPVANAISDLSEAVLRQRKNEVGSAFLSLVQSYPNDGYWRVYTADNPEVERKAVKRVDPATGKTVVRVEEQTVPMAMMSDRYFTTKVNGETYYIKLQDQRLMNAMRNIGPENNGLLVRSLSMVTRLMSSLNTSYNPEFVISNFSRDIQTALLNLTSEQSADDGRARGKKIAAKTLKAVPVAIRAINASLKGKTLDGKAGEWQKHFDQFRADGAKTGWFDMKDVDGQMEDLETMISMASGGATNAARRAFRSVTDWVENTNSAIENGVRLSAYVNAIEAGIPRAKAASLAKNMTVNFNRKGELGTTMNALYMFANASVQGTANFVRTLGRLNGVKGDPVWRRLNTAQRIAAGMAVGGFMLSALNRLVAGDDDDGVNWWDKVPDYVKERNIVIMKSLVGGKPGEYWTIPLPYGYNIFPVIGTGMEHMLASDKPAGDIASNIVLAGLGSFSPIGFEQSEELYGLVAKNIMPTILRPVASISLNENFMGGPIFKENTPFGTPKPDSALYFRSTPEMFKALAKGLNEATGGSEFRSGAVDLSPDVMQFLIGYYGGGAYNFFTSRAPNAAVKWAQGVELEDREIPFYRKLHGKVLPYDDQSKFYDRRDEINQLVDERDNLRGRERVEFVKEYRDKLRLHGVIDSVEKRLKTLREQRDRVESMNLSAAETDKRLQHIEKQMKRVIDQFNKRYNESED